MSSQLLNSGYELEYLPSSPTSSRLVYSVGSVSKSPALVPSLAYFPETPKNIENSQPLRVVEKQENGLITFYRSLSWIFGFKDKFSLLLCAYKSESLRRDPTHVLSSFHMRWRPSRVLSGARIYDEPQYNGEH